MLENRFLRSPARHPAPQTGCGREDSDATGWRRAGPRPLAGRRGPQRLPPRRYLQTDAAGGSCPHRLFCLAPGQLRVRRSRLGASEVPRAGSSTRRGGPPLTCSSASPRVPSSHEECSQIINPSSDMSVLSVPSPFHTLLLNRKIFDRKLSLSHSVSVSFPVSFYQGQSGGKCCPRPLPSFSFPHAAGASQRRLAPIVRTGEAHCPAEKLLKLVYLGGPSKAQKMCFRPHPEQGNSFKWYLLLNIRNDFTAFRGIPTVFFLTPPSLPPLREE